jgi:hypothetical protein
MGTPAVTATTRRTTPLTIAAGTVLTTLLTIAAPTIRSVPITTGPAIAATTGL